MTLHTALQQGIQLLSDGGVPAPRLTAEVLLTHALKRRREYLYAHPEEELNEIAWIHFGRYLHERLQGKPTQYITKEQEFYGRPFYVSPAVLIPRPETEHVVETVLRLAPNAQRVIDAGTGSGAIAVTLAAEMPGAKVTGTDISMEALLVAQRNAVANQTRVQWIACDLLAAATSAAFDVVASNPPYVPDGDEVDLQIEVRNFEPPVALYGGPTGNEMYARLIPEAERVLKPGGWLVMELGYRSLDAVRSMLNERWGNVEDVADLAGIPRVLAARWLPRSAHAVK